MNLHNFLIGVFFINKVIARIHIYFHFIIFYYNILETFIIFLKLLESYREFEIIFNMFFKIYKSFYAFYFYL